MSDCNQCKKFRKALVNLVGTDDKEVLIKMKEIIRQSDYVSNEKINLITAIDILLEK